MMTAVNENEIIEMLIIQFDLWDREGVLEEKLVEYGFKIIEYQPAKD